MLRTLPRALTVACLLASSMASADSHVVAPAGGNLGPLDARVDLKVGAVIANLACGSPSIRPCPVADADATTEVISIGQNRSVVHAVVRSKDAGPGALAWEAILAAGKPEPIFAGWTGFADGDPGERTGKAVKVVADGANHFVLVGDIREDLRICGQEETLLDPRASDEGSLDLRPATMQRLTAEQLAGAWPVEGADQGPNADKPLAALLVARGSSVSQSRGSELTDGDDVRTVWSERRSGHGARGVRHHGGAEETCPSRRMQFVFAPPKPDKNGAAPKHFYLVTTKEVFEVTLPADPWLLPAESFEVSFEHPVEASCLALVLSDAHTRGLAHPDVGIAEVYAFSEFDTPSATLDDVAKKLSSERGVAAAEVLKRAGEGALAAVERHYVELDDRGRALAMDVAASAERCEVAAPLLARGLCDKGGEAPRKAREKLERCPVCSGRPSRRSYTTTPRHARASLRPSR